MRLYKISLDGDFGDSDGRSAWTNNKRAIAGIMRALKAAVADPMSRPAPTVETVDFRPTVDGILEMLNQYAGRG